MSTAPIKDFRPEGMAAQFLPKDLKVKVPEDLSQWVRRPAGHYYCPLMFDVSAGITVNILHYPVPGVIGRHVHDGPVFSYTLEGSWYYPEHDWVAQKGSFIWEPPGEHHTLTVKESMTALYIMHGGLTSLDQNDKPIAVDNCLTLLGYCAEWYRDNGFGDEHIKQFIR